MTMSKKSISKYSVEMLTFLLLAGLGLLLYQRSGDEPAPEARRVAAAERKQELDDEIQSRPQLQARELRREVPTDAGWIELADEENLAPLESERLWMQRLDEAHAAPFPVEAREPLSPDRMAPSRVLAWVPGYVPFSGRFTPRAGANVLLLERAGSLEIRIADATGRPVEDCKIGLLFDTGGDEGLLTEPDSIFPDELADRSANTLRELTRTPRGWVQSEEVLDRSDWPQTFVHEAWDSRVRRTSADGWATWTELPAR